MLMIDAAEGVPDEEANRKAADVCSVKLHLMSPPRTLMLASNRLHLVPISWLAALPASQLPCTTAADTSGGLLKRLAMQR